MEKRVGKPQLMLAFGLILSFLAWHGETTRCQTLVRTLPTGQAQTLITNKNFDLSTVTSSNEITFASPVTKLQIWLSPGSSNLYVDLNDVSVAAATGNQAEIFSGAAETFVTQPITKIKVIADGGTGKASIVGN